MAVHAAHTQTGWVSYPIYATWCYQIASTIQQIGLFSIIVHFCEREKRPSPAHQVSTFKAMEFLECTLLQTHVLTKMMLHCHRL